MFNSDHESSPSDFNSITYYLKHMHNCFAELGPLATILMKGLNHVLPYKIQGKPKIGGKLLVVWTGNIVFQPHGGTWGNLQISKHPL